MTTMQDPPQAPAAAQATEPQAHPLQAHTGKFVTSAGAAFPGERAVFRGRDIHAEVMHDTSWLQLQAYGAGAELTTDQAALLDTFWVNTSYPDARVWNNRVASLAGSMRSTSALALSAAHAVSEASIFGRRIDWKAITFLQRVMDGVRAGQSIQECVDEHLRTQGKIAGYGRPLHNGDERIPAMMAEAEKYRLHDGAFVRLAFEIEEYLATTGKPLAINASALVCAFGLDFGMTPRQWTIMLYPVFLAGMTPCYLEALEDKPIGAAFAARVDQVDYTGAAPRDWDA